MNSDSTTFPSDGDGGDTVKEKSSAARPDRADRLAATPDESVGQTLGRYKLMERIGEGGCGVVYVAEQSEPVRRRVALKVIKLGMDTKAVVARFEAERQALAMMDHPHIAKVLDAGMTLGASASRRSVSGDGKKGAEHADETPTLPAGRPYFVMELVRGIRITDYCDQNRLSTQDRLKLFVQVCHAIQHAHQKGIIHRDIKPSNILVTLHDGLPVPKVIDFGIAKAIEGRLSDMTVYTHLHQFIGTPVYMSPEQAEMSGLDIDTRSDIYSLGVLLYELMTGRTPFDATELMASGLDGMRKTIREKEPVRPSTRISTLISNELSTTASQRAADSVQLLKQLRGDIDWIVMKCLEKDRTRRYETANGLAADILRHLGNEPVVARPPSTAYRMQKAWRRNRVLATAGLVVLMALVTGLGVSLWMMVQANHAREAAMQAEKAQQEQARLARDAQLRAESQRKAAEENRAQARLNLYAGDMKAVQNHLSEGNLGAAQNLLANHVPQPGEHDLRGWEWGYFHHQSRGDHLHRFEGHQHTVEKVQFSPDDRHLLSLGLRSGELILWDWVERRLIRRSIQPAIITDFAYTAEGRQIAILTDGSLKLWDYRLDQVVGECPLKEVESFVISPRDSRVFLGLKGDRLAVWDHGTGQVFTPFKTVIGSLLHLSDSGRRLLVRQGEELHLIDVASGSVLRTHALPPQGSFGVPRRMFLLNDDGTIFAPADRGQLLEPGSGQWRAPFPEDEFGVVLGAQVAINARAGLLATASFNHHLNLWDLETMQRRTRLFGHREEAWSVAISRDGRFMASGGQDRAVLLWSTQPKSEADSIRGTFADWRPVFSPDGSRLALGKLSQTNNTQSLGISIIDLTTASESASLAIPELPIGFAADGSRLFTWQHGQVHGYDTRDWSKVESHPVPQGTPLIYGDVPGARLIMRNNANEVFLVDGTGIVTPVRLKPDDWQCAAISRDGTLLAAANFSDNQKEGGRVYLWDVPGQRLLQQLHGHSRAVSDLRFSGDKRRLFSISIDSTIRVWDVNSGQEIKVLRGHRRGCVGGAITPDENTLASVNDDRTLKLWNIPTGREIGSYPVATSFMRLGFAPDGSSLALVYINNQAAGCRIWRAPAVSDSAGNPGK